MMSDILVHHYRQHLKFGEDVSGESVRIGVVNQRKNAEGVSDAFIFD
jgi:hypothetical protein